MGIEGTPPTQEIIDRFASYLEAREDPTDEGAIIAVLLFRLTLQFAQNRIDTGRLNGLTLGDMKVLIMLRTAHPRPLKPRDLEDLANLTSGGLTKVLRKLEGDGYLAMAPNPEDARSKLVSLTEAGMALIDRMLPIISRHDRETLAAKLTQTEIATLKSLLLKVSRP